MSLGGGQQLVASVEDLQEFSRLPEATRHLNPSLRGVLAEIAAMGVIRYPWPYLRPVLEVLLDNDIAEFEAFSRVEVGPAPPTAGGETPAQLRKRLRGMLREFETEAPFTLQRLCEVLLEPSKQYTRLDKLALALEKLLMVTSTVQPSRSPPERPTLASLPPVNENPPAPVLPTANGPVRHRDGGAPMANGAASRVFGDTFSTVAEAAFMNSGQFRSYHAPTTGQPQQMQNGSPALNTEHGLTDRGNGAAAPRASSSDNRLSETASPPPVANGAAPVATSGPEADTQAAKDQVGSGSVQQALPDPVTASRLQASGAGHTATELDAAAKDEGADKDPAHAAVEPASGPGVSTASAGAEASDELSVASRAVDMAVDGVEPEQPPAKRAALSSDESTANIDAPLSLPAER